LEGIVAHFELQPEVSRLQQLAEDYWTANPGEFELEKAAFEAGKKIREGDFSVENLATIVKWKSARVVHYLRENSSEKVKQALERATAPEAKARDAILSLVQLHGVGIPVASAILTAIFPERYTIIDFRALEALGHGLQDASFYEKYLAFCKNLADSGVIQPQKDRPAATALRALDRALWQWSNEHGKDILL